MTQTVEGVENRGYIRITPEDMSIHTGTTEGRNFKLYTKDKNFTIYSGENSDVKILDKSIAGGPVRARARALRAL